MVNYVAYPETDPTSKQVTRILTFIDSDLIHQSQKMLSELDRESYFRYLEADYSKRAVAEHQDELGHFGRVGPTVNLTENEKRAETLDQFINNEVLGIIEDDSILKQIEAEIKETTDAEENQRSKTKNLKSNID